jgi:Cu2+-containing amine oxidase
MCARRSARHRQLTVVSFWLKPDGFFDRNPALDVPPAH